MVHAWDITESVRVYPKVQHALEAERFRQFIRLKLIIVDRLKYY